MTATATKKKTTTKKASNKTEVVADKNSSKESGAYLKGLRVSPRKVRLVVDMIRGKKADKALTLLTFTTKKAKNPVKKLLESAISNAKQKDLDEKNLKISEATVDEGSILYRRRARARGRAATIRKRTSHISIKLKEDK